MTLKRAHRLLGLCAAVFWLIQAATGVLLTFRQEIGNSLSGGSGAPVDVAAIGRRIDAIQLLGGSVSSVWVSNFAATRFNVLYSDAAHERRSMAVNGAGRILCDVPAEGRFFNTLTMIHTELLLGEAGRWVVAVSGVLLLSNVILGIKLAWPRRGQWRQSLTFPAQRNPAAHSYGRHRTIGLYIGLPLLLIASAGIALCFADELEATFNVARDPPASAGVATELAVQPAEAMRLALERYPGSTLTALSMPTQKAPWYRVRLHASGEVPRMYGMTAVFVSAANGSVLREYPAAAAPGARAALDWLYPLHTGEAGGVVGRCLLLASGLGLLLSGFFGIRLWWQRRR